MNYLVIGDVPPKGHPNLPNLIYTAANNVAIHLSAVDVLLVDNWTDVDHVTSVLAHISRVWDDIAGCMFLSSVGWRAFLTLCDYPVLVEPSGFRAMAKVRGSTNPAVVIKVSNPRTDLSALSEYFKWLKLEVEYNVSRSYYSDFEVGRS